MDFLGWRTHLLFRRFGSIPLPLFHTFNVIPTRSKVLSSFSFYKYDIYNVYIGIHRRKHIACSIDIFYSSNRPMCFVFPLKANLYAAPYNELTVNTIFRRCRRKYHIYIYNMVAQHSSDVDELAIVIYIALWRVFIINVLAGYTYIYHRRTYHI